MRRFSVILILCVLGEWGFARTDAHAQGTISGCRTDLLQALTSSRFDENHITLSGSSTDPVRIDCDDVQLFANSVELFQVDGRFVATGDVLFVSGNSRISAERLEFNTKSKTGTFYNASGTTVIRDKAQPNQFGTQEPNAFFWGEEIQKAGPSKYRIVKGGFTACVQPTPRWEISSGAITLNLDDYALLRNSLFKVKGVPLLYLPMFYYPMEEDDRSTGFLMPIYGSGTVKGQSISAPFFWAIGRSHDATITYDWFSKAGRAVTGEYRYVLSPGSSGNSTVNLLNEREITAEDADGIQAPRPARRSYTITGSLVQALPRGFRAQANANYFTSLATQQRYQQNVFQATTRQRNFDASLTGNWAEYVLSARAERRDYFDNADTLTRTGSLPRISVSRGERPIAGLPIYFGASGEYVSIVRSTRQDDVTLTDQGLTRLDVSPTLRIPFTRWPFLTINSSVGWRGTYWTESLNAARQQVEESIGRQYINFQSRITGPVFNRIFNTPGNAFAEKFKHVVEPSLTIQRTTAIDEFARIVQLDSADYVVGNVTRLRYELANRLYAKKDVSREIASLSVSQTYYTDQQAAQFDQNYQSSFDRVARPTNFSAVAVATRVSPTERINGEFRTEWDPTVHTLKTLSASGSMRSGEWLDVSAGWSRRRVIPELPDFADPTRATHSLNAAATMRSAANRLGGSYSFNYDFQRDFFLQQRILGYYNAQCCGVVLEWQTFNLQGIAGITVPQDRRFNISFSLAGIGTFSNFLGALSGQQQQR
ncbi:MAG TPA: putative LPS assembly protein LptD [Vicinamibacterales bacterium]|nr:putative LPS assembly protein LptD [Vicinamibacterales bacterium]